MAPFWEAKTHPKVSWGAKTRFVGVRAKFQNRPWRPKIHFLAGDPPFLDAPGTRLDDPGTPVGPDALPSSILEVKPPKSDDSCRDGDIRPQKSDDSYRDGASEELRTCILATSAQKSDDSYRDGASEELRTCVLATSAKKSDDSYRDGACRVLRTPILAWFFRSIPRGRFWLHFVGQCDGTECLRVRSSSTDALQVELAQQPNRSSEACGVAFLPRMAPPS